MMVFNVQIITTKTVAITDAEYDFIYFLAKREAENWMYEQKTYFPLIACIKFIRSQYSLNLKHAKDIVDEIRSRAQITAQKPAPKTYSSLGDLLRAELNHKNTN